MKHSQPSAKKRADGTWRSVCVYSSEGCKYTVTDKSPGATESRMDRHLRAKHGWQ